ncbi:lipopolysaccharide biosynthesis protein [Streptomyces coeruleorubidus]|uniref:lipopolysaccharide biosynthesis protein n=1 Tax=Streptomyces coeruleorubidus TaxID=116188 RepID=UPI0038080587
MTSMTSTAEHPTAPAPTPRRRPLLRRLKALPPWSLLAVGALAGGLAGGAYGALTPPAYSATSYVVAVPSDKSDPQSALGFAQAYGRVATQLAVLGDAQVWAGVPVKTLRDSVRSATSPDAPMVSLTATSARADLATDMANAVSRSLIEYAKDTKGATHVELLQFSRAVKPTEPSSAPPVLTGLVGASAGGLLGGLALLARPRPTAADAARPVAVPGPATATDAQGQP